MSGINLSADRRTVKVWPDQPSAADVLDMAAALINQYGWRQGPRPDNGDVFNSCTVGSPPVGFSLHDAIGAGCERVTSLAGQPGQAVGKGDKEGSYTSPGPSGAVNTGSWREEASQAVHHAIAALTGESRTDIEFNDMTGTTVGDVLGVIYEARRKIGG